jgi:hypothetical protein
LSESKECMKFQFSGFITRLSALGMVANLFAFRITNSVRI